MFLLCKSWIEFCRALFPLFTGMLYGNVLVAFTRKYEKHAFMTFQRRLIFYSITVESRKVWTEQMTSFIYIYRYIFYTINIFFYIWKNEIHIVWTFFSIFKLWEQLILKYPFKLNTHLNFLLKFGFLLKSVFS